MTAKAIFELEAELRGERGKGASRRLRRLQGEIPAIIYGGDKPPVAIRLVHKNIAKALEHKAFYSHILTLHIKDNHKEQVVLKDLQRHHFKKAIYHVDFQRVSATEEMHLHVPLNFVGESTCPGIKAGGMVNHYLIDVEVRCLASLLPESIEVDLSQMKLDQIFHLSDLKLPKGVALVALSHGNVAEHDQAVVSIHLPRSAPEPEATTETKVTEVMLKGKEANPATAEGTNNKDKTKGK